MILVKFITLCLMSIFIISNSKAKPPDIVWRVDTREYGEIFNNGFYSAGTNDNVIEHLSGRSCRGAESDYGDSAFVSTTSNRQFAYEYAERILQHMNERGDANAQVNIYQVRATDNIYSAEQTLDYLLLRYGRESHREILRIIRYTSHLSEWMAHRRIEPEQIATVTQYYLLRGSVHSNGQLANPRYQQTRSTANISPYDNAYFSSQYLRLARIWLLRSGVRPMVSACFGMSMEHSEFKRALVLENIKGKEMFKFIILL
ncbi:putative AB5 enterotoxin ADP-ribosylating subunit YtxA [Yersinia enterocolitica]|uniref:putative AB5 enterotoxin ADP-ribosylating subunit YtxA n=1 Tax=Yersinia enterocolitica TaxID=630 RepID=UPI001CA5D80C|nr:putative AB5 enterotoxin ADP-ribosylating subunit YtxA [Yersinia enterocolitica]MBW5832162.1 putative AB5 enterotoxin ADP-ribosylating subunit YtxA [Yersinia enterocolitica]